MDLWQVYREKHLKRLEEALKRGEVDPPAVPLLEIVNRVPDAVSTSSCSGRVVLLETDVEERKRESAFHRKWHRPVTTEELLEGFRSFSGEVLWLKMDPLIFHVATRTLDLAREMVSAAREAGIKVAGIQVIDPWKVNVEVRGIDQMAVPLYWKGEPLLDEEHVRRFVPIVNRKMLKNQRRLEKLYDSWYKLFNELYPDLFP
ncbi:MAG: hypothetical protein GXO00_00405 [Candidatus Diapherotrites archaeon]|nr:hypothetical protein [Candidatus Diapherotrites archaeon]